MTVYIDPDFAPDELRREIFAGSLIVLTRLPAVAELVAHTRAELVQLFAPHEPEHVHESLSPAELAAVLGAWKPAFIHSAEAQRLVTSIITEAGLPLEQTHYDVPKPRTAFPQGSLNTGVGFAFPWHRDVWYAAPAQQINWWLPIWPARPDNAMSFDRRYFGREVPNDSDRFDYYQLNAARNSIAQQVTKEVQARPKAVDHNADDELIVLPPPGGILLFSGAQLHTSIPNTSGRTRYSIDFRTVDARDVADGVGAPVVDAYCTGTAIRDFHNAADGSGFDEGMVRRLFGEPPEGAMLTFEPSAAGSR